MNKINWGAAAFFLAVVVFVLSLIPPSEPIKVIEKITAVESAQMKGAWHSREWIWLPPENCSVALETPLTKQNMTLYGAGFTPWGALYHNNSVNTASASDRVCMSYINSTKPGKGWCDSAKERCRFRGREKGCFVSTGWFEWAQAHVEANKLSLTYDFVCSTGKVSSNN